MSGAEFMDELATLPLLNHPGAVWDYGFGLDVLGQVVEKVSGQTLGEYFEENISQAARHDRHRRSTSRPRRRRATPRRCRTIPTPAGAQSVTPVLTQPLKFECGGGCLSSTVGDYMRFALRC